jgi:asparagine synthetase B (glutamine-hydrolysing)
MFSYALAVARPGRVLPPSVLSVLRDQSPAELRFQPAEHVLWSSPTGSVVFGGWQHAVDATGSGGHVHRSESGVTAFTGYAWPRRGSWRPDGSWAAQLSTYLRRHPLTEGTDELLGLFTVISLDSAGHGVVASDPLGLSLIYWGENRDFAVLSSRAHLAARILTGRTDPPRDPLGASWLAFTGSFVVGSKTGFDGVEVVPAESFVEIDAEHGARIRRTGRRPWRFAGRPDRTAPELISELRDDIATSIRAARAMPVCRHIAELTGGKDSRLVLAVLLEEGLAGEFDFRTFGTPDLPDVTVAKQIAATFGLQHQVGPDDEERARRQAQVAAMDALREGSTSDHEILQRVHVGSWSGMRSVGNSKAGGAPHGDRVVVSGLCGEALRTNYPGTAKLTSVDQLDRLITVYWPFGVAGILRPDAREYYERELRRVMFEHYTEGDAPQDLVDAFYIRNRLRRWFGTSQEMDEQNLVCPLYSPFGIRTAFAIGPEERHAGRIHFEIVERANARLARLPFDRGGWSEHVLAAPADAETNRPVGQPNQPLAAPRQTRRGISGVRRRRSDPEAPTSASRERRDLVFVRQRKREPMLVEIMRRYFSDASNPVFDVMDRTAVIRALDDFGELPAPAKTQMYGALTAAMWIGHHEIILPKR